MKNLACLWLCLFTTACSHLDVGGNDGQTFELKFFWDRAPKTGVEDPENPGFDRDGNRIPSPEVYATYYFPDIHAGTNVVVQPAGRITPTLGVELLEFKLPYLRWFNVQIQGGANLLDIYMGKRLTSIFEITIGGWAGRDFDGDAWAWGLGATLIKF